MRTTWLLRQLVWWVFLWIATTAGTVHAWTPTTTTATTHRRRSSASASSLLLLGHRAQPAGVAGEGAAAAVAAVHLPSSSSAPNRDLLLVRAARGEITERTPVWLMRQAGRYMQVFRQYSDRLPFRERSETPEIAVELSLQCHRAYQMDGIIMFSDILTPLPCLGIEFDVVKGVGPVITTLVRTEDDVKKLQRYSVEEKTPFIKEILHTLKQEAITANTSLIGFVGAPFTLASYTIEGKSSKNCETTHRLMLEDEAGTNRCMSLFLDQLSHLIMDYANYQIDSGAEVLQIFESWAHQLSPEQFQNYAKPAVERVIRGIQAQHPHVPIIYFANGGSSYLELQKDLPCDMIGLDWGVDMGTARQILGDKPVSGNIDPNILKFGTKQQIEEAVRTCIDKAGGPGNAHVLNLGHGVMQGTPEENVRYFVDACKAYTRD